MGATPMVEGPGNRPALRGRPKQAPAKATPAESGAWGYFVHPSLLPTIFAPSGEVPSGEAEQQPTARKV